MIDDKMKIIGIDDAGRGPVLGPMILSGVLINDSEEKELAEVGVKDSKQLTPNSRKKIGKVVEEKYAHHLEVATPSEIDEAINLNHLEAIKMAMVVNKLLEDVDEKVRVIVDCPSINIESWSEFLEKLIDKKKDVELVCEHKADANHLVVAAASVLAKERREKEMEELRKKFGIDFGSGYPGDPKTKKFVSENFDSEKFNSLIRSSWETIKKLKRGRNQNKLF